MTYLDPVDSQTIKRIGFNVTVLIAVSLVLVAVVSAIT
jgi:hypothetical protein